jgi:NADH:ubiquinone oxidoreductase subunit E
MQAVCLLAASAGLLLPVAQHAHAAVHMRTSMPMMSSPLNIEVCQKKYCKSKGSAKTLKTLQELAEGRDDVCVRAADMSHTEHGCFDECTMGPNVRVGGAPQTDDGRVTNGVKGEDACAELLAKVAA